MFSLFLVPSTGLSFVILPFLYLSCSLVLLCIAAAFCPVSLGSGLGKLWTWRNQGVALSFLS